MANQKKTLEVKISDPVLDLAKAHMEAGSSIEELVAPIEFDPEPDTTTSVESVSPAESPLVGTTLPPLMNADYINLDKAVEDFKTAPSPPAVEYPTEGENFDWRSTGYWGGYHEQADDSENAKEISRRMQDYSDIEEVVEDSASDIDTHLGRTTEYPDKYDPSVLVREDRQSNRNHLDINSDSLPFTGYDLWNAYELSCLTKSGVPISATGRILYPCDSKYLVESKSLKLYLNSYNMTRLGSSPESALSIMQDTIQADLSELLQSDVKVQLYLCSDPFKAFRPNDIWSHDMIFNTGDRSMPGDKFTTLERAVTVPVHINDYVETPELLKEGDFGPRQDVFYHSSLLKSNCKVTHQPDWGDVFIYMNTSKRPDLSSLLQYIVSFRNENHFHEEICETIFKRLLHTYEPDALGVSCLYVRRGGIDINPTRVTRGRDDLVGKIHDPAQLHALTSHIKLTRQ